MKIICHKNLKFLKFQFTWKHFVGVEFEAHFIESSGVSGAVEEPFKLGKSTLAKIEKPLVRMRKCGYIRRFYLGKVKKNFVRLPIFFFF